MDPILRTLVEYGLELHEARAVLALARMAQVLVYGVQPPPQAVPGDADRPAREGSSGMDRMDRMEDGAGMDTHPKAVPPAVPTHPGEGEGFGAPTGMIRRSGRDGAGVHPVHPVKQAERTERTERRAATDA